MKLREVIFFFLLAFTGNLFLIWLFWSAQLSHGLGAEIIPAGPLVLAAEFLAIYAGGIISGKRIEPERSFEGRELPSSPQKRRMVLLVAFVLAGLFVGWFLEHEQLAFFFIASLLVKYFGHRAVRSHPMTVISYVWFLMSFAVFVVPESVFGTLTQLMGHSLETMNRFLSWGVAYFAVFAVITVVLFAREYRKVKWV